MHRLAPRAFLVLSLVPFLCGPAGAAGPERREARVDASFALQLDPDGRIVSLQPVGRTAQGLDEVLRREVGDWTFEPGRIDGRGVPTETTLNLTLGAGRAGDDDVALRIVDASTGPRVARTVPPRYPPRALRAGESGEVLLQVAVDTDGRATEVVLAQSNTTPSLEQAAIAAVRQWTFQPERVDGRPIAARIVLPLRFCITGRPCRRLPLAEGGGDSDHPRLVGAPTVRIVRPGGTG